MFYNAFRSLHSFLKTSFILMFPFYPYYKNL